ncbi:MAG: formate dehydrogenase subunit gamma [Solirubrobacterales bacterium]
MEFLREYEADVPRIERFSLPARIAHWGHTVSFLILLFTGLILFADSRDWLPIGGYHAAGYIHRFFAITFILIPLGCLAAEWKGFIEWWKDVFGFGKNDIAFQMVFPLEFLGFHVTFPAQTKFNGGEKMNSVVTTGSCVMVAISGLIMWFPTLFPQWLSLIAIPTHDIFMVLATTMVCMHGYLGSFHPGSGESFWGMWKGTVKSEWAEHHHKAWYDKMVAEKE